MSDQKLENLKGRVKTLEDVVVKLFDMFLKTFTVLFILTFLLIVLALCWFLGITSDQAVSYYNSLANTPVWIILLALIGFSGVSYWSILKFLSKHVRRFYWDKVVLSFLSSLKDKD